MKLDPKIKAQIESDHNLKIPHPTDAAFAPFMEDLFKRQPEVARNLEQAVILESLGDPKSFLERKALVAERLSRLKHTLFFRFDDIQSRWFPSRTKIIFLSLTPVLLFMVAMYAPRFVPKAGVVAQNPAVQAVGHQLGFGSLYEVDLGNTPPDMTIQSPAPREMVQPKGIPEAAPAPIKESVQTPPPPPPLQSVTTFQREQTQSPKVFTRESIATVTDPFTQERVTVGLSVFQRDSPLQLHLSRETQEVTTLTVKTREGTMAVLAQDTQSQDNPSQTQDIFATASAPFIDVPNSPAPNETVRATKNAIVSGSQINARLEVGIMTLDHQKVPVIARAEDDSLWQGEASLNNQRFEVVFSSVTKDGVSQEVKAYAVSEDGFVGLPVTWRETTPTLAGDLLRGSLSGISNYVEDLSQQTTVIQDEFGKTITRNLPSIEMQMLGSLSQLFKPSTDQAMVRVAELPSGSPFRIVVF